MISEDADNKTTPQNEPQHEQHAVNNRVIPHADRWVFALGALAAIGGLIATWFILIHAYLLLLIVSIITIIFFETAIFLKFAHWFRWVVLVVGGFGAVWLCVALYQLIPPEAAISTEPESRNTPDEKKTEKPETKPMPKIIPPSTTPENRAAYFSGFRVINQTESSIEVEATYFYDGSLGKEGCFVYASPTRSDGTQLSGGGQDGGQISITGRTAQIRFTYTNKPKTAERTTKILLAMQCFGHEPFAYREFPFSKVWK